MGSEMCIRDRVSTDRYSQGLAVVALHDCLAVSDEGGDLGGLRQDVSNVEVSVHLGHLDGALMN